MKWTKPVVGQTRTKTKFLIFPKTLQDSDRVYVVTRWFEIVKIKQHYKFLHNSYLGDIIGIWENLHWEDI